MKWKVSVSAKLRSMGNCLHFLRKKVNIPRLCNCCVRSVISIVSIGLFEGMGKEAIEGEKNGEGMYNLW